VSEFVNVTTQAALDKALANGDIPVCRDGFFVVGGNSTVRAWDNSTVRAGGNSTVRAGGNSTVEAWDNSTVRAWGNSTVEAGDNSTVRAGGNSTVEAGGNSTVEAWGNSTVRAGGNSTVRAWDNSTVRAGDNSTVRAGGNSTVEAGGNSTVEAWDNSTVEAWGNSTVRAGKYVAIHRRGLASTIKGGIVIQVPTCETVEEFCDYYDLKPKRKKVVLFKLVNDDFRSDHGADYSPGSKTTCSDWNDHPSCGGGLHFSPRPMLARKYSNGTRFVACEVALDTIVTISDAVVGSTVDKVKAPACRVLFECDEDGERITS
jgi:hypothetical protein